MARVSETNKGRLIGPGAQGLRICAALESHALPSHCSSLPGNRSLVGRAISSVEREERRAHP